MWGSETFELRPDILTCAKRCHGVYAPISALLMNDNIISEDRKSRPLASAFSVRFTYSAHPLSAAVALRTLEIYEEKNILDHVDEVKDSFIERVKDLKNTVLLEIQGHIGLIGAIEFVAEPNTNKKPDPRRKVAAKIQQKIQESGVILRALPGDSLGFCPPLIIEKRQIHEMFDKIDSVLSRIEFQNL